MRQEVQQASGADLLSRQRFEYVGDADAGDADPARKLFVLGFSFIVIGGLVSATIIAVAGRFVAAARANPRAARWFDYGFAGLMGAFAARLMLAQGR